jgi:hypothetical protein
MISGLHAGGGQPRHLSPGIAAQGVRGGAPSLEPFIANSRNWSSRMLRTEGRRQASSLSVHRIRVSRSLQHDPSGSGYWPSRILLARVTIEPAWEGCFSVVIL